MSKALLLLLLLLLPLLLLGLLGSSLFGDRVAYEQRLEAFLPGEVRQARILEWVNASSPQISSNVSEPFTSYSSTPTYRLHSSMTYKRVLDQM
jgi:hypothetical protein